MKKTTGYVFAAAAVLLVLFLIWTDFPSRGNEHPHMTDEQTQTETDTGTDSPPSAAELQSEKQLAAYQGEEREIMETMMEEMMDLPASTDPALDYLRGMLPHHRAAIRMAESYLEYGGSHEELTEIADDIISQQKEELAQMEQMIQEIETKPDSNQDKRDAYMEDYNTMMEESHDSHMDESGIPSLDRAFTEGMLLHHQMAVDMSGVILDYTDHQDVRDLAEQIISAQTGEIDRMQVILQEFK